MELRPELMPPVLDERLVERLAELAANLDGDRNEEMRAEFNRLAGTDIPMAEFQGIYGGQEHDEWVRKILCLQRVRPALGVTREELAEVVKRARSVREYGIQHELYMIVFDANVPLERASFLIFYPPDFDDTTGTWGGGRPICEYDPTPEQIVEWALAVSRVSLDAAPGTSSGKDVTK